MCGIAGMWASRETDSAAVTSRMTAALHHRGPDSNGHWQSSDGALALGHARLAIVDLSAQGHQPMTSRSGRFVIVFNGEIYNHLEIRRDLAQFSWRGHSDTETLLEAIEQWGLVAALNASIGMFALAVWDKQSRSLSLARDRMGEKPLYYGFGRNGLAFASELKALRHCPGLDFSLSAVALRGYVEYGYVAGPLSVYAGVKKLPPATVLVLDAAESGAQPTRYWSFPSPGTGMHTVTPTHAEDEERTSTLESLLRSSVKQQMLADVPIGAFLSGGIDSSLIVAMMQSESSRRIRTFSMGFGDGADDELSTARQTAGRLGTEHTELLVTPQDVLDIVPRMADIYDEPFGDSSQVPTVLLCQLTRRHVTVALSGDAGDELFGGYNRYLFAAHLGGRVQRWPHVLRRGIGAALDSIPSDYIDAASTWARSHGLGRLPPSLGEKVGRIARFVAARSGKDAYLGTLSQWLDPETVPVDGDASEPRLEVCASMPLPQQMMRWDMEGYLPDDILVKVDRAAMAYGLETRVPFLDYRIVEFALATPMAFKIRDRRTKWLLRELLARHLPDAQFERPKQGFTVPLDTWLRGPLKEWAESLLDARELDKCALLDVARVRRAWQEHLSGRRNHQRSLWTVLMLQAWLQRQR